MIFYFSGTGNSLHVARVWTSPEFVETKTKPLVL